jgi:hypothetical protein
MVDNISAVVSLAAACVPLTAHLIEIKVLTGEIKI